MDSIFDKNAYNISSYLGCHPGESGCVFRLWAPNAGEVSVVGDFNGWNTSVAPMTRDECGIWSATIPNTRKGHIYKYAVTGADGKTVFKSDPCAVYGEACAAGGSVIWSPDSIRWTDDAWMRRRSETDIRSAPVNIYEVHLGSWRKQSGKPPAYRQVAPALAAYCRMMGYTHVELMPLSEYPYDPSWGYQATGWFSPTSRYGTPQDFMFFVDTLHAAGIGVIMDWVAAHFPRDTHGLARFDGTPLYEYPDPRMGEHPQWGTLVFNLSSAPVRSFLISSALFFLNTYHLDGLRCDAVSSTLYLDYGRAPGQWLPNRDGGNINYDAVAFWKEFNTAVAENAPGTFTAAEESTAFPLITGAPEDGGLGFTFKWDMGFMHDTLAYFSMDPLFRSQHHDKLTFSMMYAFSERFILAFSHDEAVHGKKSLIGKMFGSYEEKFAALRAMYGYIFAHPGKKLTFMGGEFAQFIEWDYKKELDWLLLDYPMHRAMQHWCAALGHIYLAEPALYETEDSWDGFLWLNPDDKNRSSIAFLRLPASEKNGIVCIYNFTPVAYTDFLIGLPGAGTLLPLLSSDNAAYGGGGTKQTEIFSCPGEFREFHHTASVPLPPLSAQYYRYKEDAPCQTTD